MSNNLDEEGQYNFGAGFGSNGADSPVQDPPSSDGVALKEPATGYTGIKADYERPVDPNLSRQIKKAGFKLNTPELQQGLEEQLAAGGETVRDSISAQASQMTERETDTIITDLDQRAKEIKDFVQRMFFDGDPREKYTGFQNAVYKALQLADRIRPGLSEGYRESVDAKVYHAEAKRQFSEIERLVDEATSHLVTSRRQEDKYKAEVDKLEDEVATQHLYAKAEQTILDKAEESKRRLRGERSTAYQEGNLGRAAEVRRELVGLEGDIERLTQLRNDAASTGISKMRSLQRKEAQLGMVRNLRLQYEHLSRELRNGLDEVRGMYVDQRQIGPVVLDQTIRDYREIEALRSKADGVTAQTLDYANKLTGVEHATAGGEQFAQMRDSYAALQDASRDRANGQYTAFMGLYADREQRTMN